MTFEEVIVTFSGGIVTFAEVIVTFLKGIVTFSNVIVIFSKRHNPTSDASFQHLQIFLPIRI